MIPKIIHYLWFGDVAKKPIDRISSWKKILSDFEFKEWGESNLDIDKYEASRRMYDAKRYGPASDSLRIDILAEEGGIWLDTDIIIHRDLSDFLSYSFFIGHNRFNFSVGLIGAEPHHPYILKVREWYENNWSKCMFTVEEFKKKSFDTFFLANYSSILERVFKQRYKCVLDGKSKTLDTKDGLIRVENSTVFTFKKDSNPNCYAEHLYEGTWLSNNRLYQKTRK
jgi:mannosyltransferase OCH1-like enzyme